MKMTYNVLDDDKVNVIFSRESDGATRNVVVTMSEIQSFVLKYEREIRLKFILDKLEQMRTDFLDLSKAIDEKLKEHEG